MGTASCTLSATKRILLVNGSFDNSHRPLARPRKFPWAMGLKIPLTAFGRPLTVPHRWFWRFGRVVAWLCGGRRATAMREIPREGPAVVIAPHLSFFDALFLHALLPRPSRFFAAAFFVTRNAPLSWLFYLGGVIPVERHKPDATAVRRALRLLARGEMVAFFPEGGRTWTGVPSLPMTPAVKLLLGVKVPIYVATVDGSYDCWPRFDPVPRPRRVRVRIAGALALPRARPASGRRRAAAARHWWSAVYAPGRRADVPRAAAEIRAQFAAAAAGEPARLRLEIPARLEALARVLCFCPECAAAALALRGRSLVCPSCGTAFRAAGAGRLRRFPSGEDLEAEQSLHGFFLRMVSGVEARATSGFCLEEAVGAGEVPQAAAAAGAIHFVPASARLDRDGLRIVAAGRELRLPLAAVAASTMMGSDTLEVWSPGSETVLYLRAQGGALRILLAARAFLRLPIETMNP